jgi:hypothetical protein
MLMKNRGSKVFGFGSSTHLRLRRLFLLALDLERERVLLVALVALLGVAAVEDVEEVLDRLVAVVGRRQRHRREVAERVHRRRLELALPLRPPVERQLSAVRDLAGQHGEHDVLAARVRQVRRRVLERLARGRQPRVLARLVEQLLQVGRAQLGRQRDVVVGLDRLAEGRRRLVGLAGVREDDDRAQHPQRRGRRVVGLLARQRRVEAGERRVELEVVVLPERLVVRRLQLLARVEHGAQRDRAGDQRRTDPQAQRVGLGCPRGQHDQHEQRGEHRQPGQGAVTTT